MKGLYESLREKELELQQALDEAAEANERELRRVRKSLQEALGVVDQLLGASAITADVDVSSLPAINVTSIDTTPAESGSAERLSSPPAPDTKKPVRSSQSAIAACFGDASVREFP
jgi:hypothetical protein